jgi:hypothetical protein
MARLSSVKKKHVGMSVPHTNLGEKRLHPP